MALSQELAAYRDIPALVHLNSKEQADTIGFNLVEGICSLLYRPILNGEVPLYVSPKKELRIDGNSLLALENSSGTQFETCPDIFFHEYWSSNRKTTAFKIEGFSFVNKNRLEQKVAYGYVDVRDIDSLLLHAMIKNTVNGYAQLSFSDALMSRRYLYHLVQMGEETFQSDPSLAVRLKRDAFSSGKLIR
ncbi:MAG: hypothetical protein LPK45_05635, partial [Bacteroidota bacterium]|nr:hypothetical protein [Bacteroidota bacterium]MDX5430550.1 hypothetical protein [Bacteroidota bacterium]MDX5469302.1 hypothetical protein [Bacteroidota bacterium]